MTNHRPFALKRRRAPSRSRTNIAFKSADITLRGWLYTPKQQSSLRPCVIMTHGFSALKEHYLDKFAARFADAGMNVLVYDNRNFGDSDGAPRLEVDAIAQVTDMKNAITFAQTLPNVDAQKIGIWGTSFSAGIALEVAATDKRVACVVAQVPFVSGQNKLFKITDPERWEKLERKFTADRAARAAGKPPALISVVTDNPDKPAVMKQPEAYTFFTSIKAWENQVTLKSIENAGLFEPINNIEHIRRIPLLFIVANHDTVNSTNLALQAYEQALAPKKLVMIDGEHFAPYIEQFDICVAEACAWFGKYTGIVV